MYLPKINKQIIFNKNDNILYIKKNVVIKAIIKEIHYDDNIPYYTIEINGREIQTISKYLRYY